MDLKSAIEKCHVRSAIYRAVNPGKKYWKNSVDNFRYIPEEDKKAMDWEEYDPREYDDCSLSAFND